MTTVVLRIRMTSGQHMDVTYEEPDSQDADQVIANVVATLARDSGILRTRHGDRLVAVYGRGVAALEVAPRGAVL